MTTLQDQLDEITANTRNLVQAERLAVSERSVEELFATGIEERILPVGALAPEFELHDAAGRLVRSQDMLALGPLVIKFLRGRWCPYCVTELEAWRDLYGTIRERGALMVAIGPQTERQNDFMADQHGLPFPVLCDPGCELAEKFGLADADYAAHGGSFPLNVASAGIVGTVTVSGLPQRLDHELVVEVLCQHLGKDYASLALPKTGA